ncbi:MAG: cysteine--tRNA ligase [Gammaproteobacteria bacterium]
MLKIYNSLTRQKQEFKPRVPNQVGIYVCGMTVYDYCHLGHARSMVSFDMVVRYLRARGYQVHYVRNITDIDDKIIHRAQEAEEDYQTLTAKFIKAMQEDIKALNILPADEEPRATQYMDSIIDLIQRLIDNNVAYITEEGDVYYAVDQFERYGELSRKDLQGQEAGARVEVVDSKRNPLDFVLWKSAKPGEPHWPAPWGTGRPGWHVECSAMAIECLGENFDIHGGGYDLQFPHHENEIAQSEAATGKTFANFWMHVGFLQIDRQKMSKSLGNFFTIREVLQQYHPETIRYFLLSSHYRSQLNYSLDNLTSAEEALTRFYIALRDMDLASSAVPAEKSGYEQRFNAAMDDDFNTPEALAVLFELTREINRLRESDNKAADPLVALLKKLAAILGLLDHKANDFLQWGSSRDEVKTIEDLVTARNEARQQKNWQEADRLRGVLTSMNVELEDQASGTVWRKI